MAKKLTYEELEKRVKELEAEVVDFKRVAKELHDSHDYLENLFNYANAPIIVWDPKGAVTRFNHAFEHMTGFTADEVIGQKLSMLFPEASRDESLSKIALTLGGEYWQSVEIPILRKDGDIRVALWNSANIYAVEGTAVIATIAQGQDISELKQTQQALMESQAEKKAILDGITTNMRFVNEDLEMLWVNKAGAASVNKSPEEMIGHRCYEFWGDQPNKPCSGCPAIKALRTKETQQITRHTPDGKLWDLKAEPVSDDKGDLVGIVEIAHDITDKSLLEAQFQAAQRMEAMGTLAGGIAHNFNNILMAIQGNASLVLLRKTSDHRDYERLKGIEQGVRSGAELTRQLLGFARGGKYEARPTNLNELIENQNRMFGRTKKEITIRGKYEENLSTVEVDQGQIEQVLLNLYVNAWQAMPAGGDLYLQTENVTLDENYTKPFSIEPGRYVKISVTDTGVGMDKKTRDRIFDPFFTTKEMGRGTGLGLASVYGIVRNHGGIINVASKKGKGATFTICLPASEKQVIEEKESVGEALKGTETVLLVDDEDMIIDVGEGILKELGYKVLIARSGKEAIDVYKANKDKIDMVILDMIMSGVGGGKAYDRMKKINRDIKILLSSGYNINGQAEEILERGCDGFIQKPFNMRQLSRKLREILDKK